MTDEVSMRQPHLILHKVRGEPAFDIAVLLEPIEGLDEDIWIIPTSGHRAYPFAMAKFQDGIGPEFHDNAIKTCVNNPHWDEWPDHYQVSQDKERSASAPLTFREGQELLAKMGFEIKPSTFVRRV